MSRIPEASLNLHGELAVDTWWEEREAKHWPASFPACLWNSFLWGIFLMSDKWQWQDRIVLEACNGVKCWQKPGLWKPTFEQLRAPLAHRGIPVFAATHLIHLATKANVTDDFFRTMLTAWMLSTRYFGTLLTTSWSYCEQEVPQKLPGLSYQALGFSKITLCLDDVRLVSCRGFLT